MKKCLFLILTAGILFLSGNLYSQDKVYKPNWESLDSRPVAKWFQDAKFGIFIHWGPYSVPAWSPKGTYSEWYQYWMQNKKLSGNGDFTGTEVFDYHVKTYGKDFSYYQFGKMFTADLFKPDKWASFFKKAGAKYIVLTSKHHDGFCLWPSREADDRGFPWNSMETGAHRDLIGELSASVKNAEIKMGLYYSIYEWFHPWWLNDKSRFIKEHFHPQFKDLIERYKPDIAWSDGGWSLTAEEWQTPELLAWLFNESSVKNTVVINDRWGKGLRKKHGGYYTAEYEASSSFDRPWEECRGIGFSFGYNRNEDAEDYSSPKTIVSMLSEIVSNGGNLLLDIGPDRRGRIPVIMQERLLQVGKWLDTYGEAIYGTRTWNKHVQWSAGRRDYKPFGKRYIGGDYILKLTIDPDPGYAVKEIFFTRKNNTLYAVCPKWPGENLFIKDCQVSPDGTVSILPSGEKLTWENLNGSLKINMPQYNPDDFKPEQRYAYVFKISHIKN